MRIGNIERIAYDWGCAEGNPADLPMTRKAYCSVIREVRCSTDFEDNLIVTIARL